MAEGAPLLALLRRIRRRVRFFAALEGGIAGVALAALALAARIALARRHGGALASIGAAWPIWLGSAGLLAGAGVRAARRIPLVRCARIADAALDGQERVLSALWLGGAPGSPLVRALVADAVSRCAGLAPDRLVPPRRPRGLPALGLAAIGLCGAIAARPARAGRPPQTVAARAPLAPLVLDVEREEADAAIAEAAGRDDQRFAALAQDFERTVRVLSAGTLDDGAGLAGLRALEARSAKAAGDAERDGRALAAASRALEESAGTRAAGEALAAAGEEASERARAALGSSAGARPTETGQALAAAARGVAQSWTATSDAPKAPGPRRLGRDGSDAGPAATDQPAPPAASDARHLEQLRRDLDDAAAACRAGDPSCRARAESRAEDLARLGRRAAAADGLRRLERAAGQLHARIARGELRDGDDPASRRFGQAANGQRGGQREPESHPSASEDGTSGTGASAAPQTPSSAPSGGGDENGSGAAAPGAGALSQGAGLETGAGVGTGDGIGRQPGGPPLGRRDATASRGNDTEARLQDGAGPDRVAEVIGHAADRGFVSRGYARAFTDYAAAVEDALAASAVPEGKRYIVRRYFDLIRPRSPR